MPFEPRLVDAFLFAGIVMLPKAATDMCCFGCVTSGSTQYVTGLAAVVLPLTLLNLLVIPLALGTLLGIVAHGILLMTGPVRSEMSRSVEIMLYASVPMLIAVIPLWPITMVGYVGWAIVGSIMLSAGQKVETWRAVVCGVAMGVVALLFQGSSLATVFAIIDMV